EANGSMTNDDPSAGPDLDELEAILAVATADGHEPFHAVADGADAIFTWEYRKGERAGLARLYERAKASQWNAETDLPWHVDVDPARVVAHATRSRRTDPVLLAAQQPGEPLAGWGDAEWAQLRV